jgi:jumonji domain-containing protein 7
MQLHPVERISADTIHDVARQLASSERPLVIIGGGAVAAAEHWTVERFRSEFGTLQIPVRKTDDEFKVFFGQDMAQGASRPTMTVSDYLQMTQAAIAGQRPPYAGNISIFHDPLVAGKFERLVTDCQFPEWSLPYTNDEYRLWLGAAGQRSTIHNDSYHNFNAQIIGVKRFVLFAPDQHALLYPDFFHRGMWASPVDPRRPNFDAYPDFAKARGFDCELTAGEVLFIPRFWWHYVEALTFALNVNRWVSPEGGQDRFWHQQPEARGFISFTSLIDQAHQRFNALPQERQESLRPDFDALEADLLRLMASTA